MSDRVVVSGGTVVTMDGDRSEYAAGYVVVEDGRVSSVGSGPAPGVEDARVVDARGCVVTPGLVNTHHHLYQWVTRGLAVDATLFEWLTTLYPVWGCIDEESVGAAATAGLGWLAKTGCTTSMDHHYVFPADGGDLL
ncbi:MAG: amidohydrolase family protein, partial [Lapillicoccus sp.]